MKLDIQTKVMKHFQLKKKKATDEIKISIFV